MLLIYNSLTRTKEVFKPLVPGKVGLYVCGVTVYDRCHLGHARAMVCVDVIVRFLREYGYEVTFVRNITDIDDKIIVRAAERCVSVQELTSKYIDALHSDANALYCLPPTLEPRATTSIAQMINLISRLIDNGHAYVTEQGDVCYEVAKFANYGKLSQQALEGLMSGVRVDVDQEKRSPLDFVLWKKAKPGEPEWSSPWGKGRPGWHIECSAMAMEALGEQFDLHGGGLDLQFPHHENEIAQSEGATGKPFANYWLHVGLLQINQEKMAKSLGNFFTIESVLEKHNPEVVRYFLLSSHYRSALNYSEDGLILAEKALTRLYQSIKDVPLSDNVILDEIWVQKFYQAMQDDFNTPEALAVLFQLSHSINKTKLPKEAATLKHLAWCLGLLQQAPELFLKNKRLGLDPIFIESEIEKRNQARKNRDFKAADLIRDGLLAIGVELEDGPNGTVWRIG